MENFELPSEGETVTIRRTDETVTITGIGHDRWSVERGGIVEDLVREGENLILSGQGTLRAPAWLMLGEIL